MQFPESEAGRDFNIEPPAERTHRGRLQASQRARLGSFSLLVALQRWGSSKMRAVIGAVFGMLFTMTAHAADDTQDTVALINARFASDAFYDTDGYSIAMPSACIVEIIPHGSRFASAKRQRIALHVLDRGGLERWSPSTRADNRHGERIRLIGRPELMAKQRKGFPASYERDEKGFPKSDEAMLSYGIEFRLYDRNSARDVARAFVLLASGCAD
jgi:hypothetical protein